MGSNNSLYLNNAGIYEIDLENYAYLTSIIFPTITNNCNYNF
jgi:hypothetical protein